MSSRTVLLLSSTTYVEGAHDGELAKNQDDSKLSQAAMEVRSLAIQEKVSEK